MPPSVISCPPRRRSAISWAFSLPISCSSLRRRVSRRHAPAIDIVAGRNSSRRAATPRRLACWRAQAALLPPGVLATRVSAAPRRRRGQSMKDWPAGWLHFLTRRHFEVSASFHRHDAISSLAMVLIYTVSFHRPAAIGRALAAAGRHFATYRQPTSRRPVTGFAPSRRRRLATPFR